jgi:hypothetical protein
MFTTSWYVWFVLTPVTTVEPPASLPMGRGSLGLTLLPPKSTARPVAPGSAGATDVITTLVSLHEVRFCVVSVRFPLLPVVRLRAECTMTKLE